MEQQRSIIDHIGIGVPEFDAALMDMEKQLGVRLLDLGAFGAQRRAAGWLDGSGFLEVLGPAAADIASLDPMMRLAAGLPVPVVPWIIQWIARAPAVDGWPQLGQLTRCHREHPGASTMEDILSAFRMPMPVSKAVTPRALLAIKGEAGLFEVNTACRPPGT